MKITLRAVYWAASLLAGVVLIVLYIYKANPRIYLTNNVNMAYVNENIADKNFKDVKGIMEKFGYKITDESGEVLKNLQGVYIIFNNKVSREKDSGVAILDFGYMYPAVTSRLDKYFRRVDGMYMLRQKYLKQFSIKGDIYLLPSMGNFLISRRRNHLLEIKRSEKYISPNFLRILEREKKSNLGMLMLNMKEAPLAGFDELVIVGNTKNSKVDFTLKISGKNEIIKSLNGISDDGLSGNRKIQRNNLYLRSTRDKEMKLFMLFINYFARSRFIEEMVSRVHINEGKVTSYSQGGELSQDVINIDFGKKQFLYGDMDLMDLKGMQKKLGHVELIGEAEENRLKINAQFDEKTIVNIIREFN